MSLTAHDILMDADLFRAAYPRWPSAGTPDPLALPPVTGRELTDYSDDPRFAIPPASSKTTQRMTRLLAGEEGLDRWTTSRHGRPRT
jgi:hypothetical protein